MRKLKIFLLGGFMLGFVSVFSFVYADNAPTSSIDKSSDERRIKGIYDQLNLTADQRTQLQQNKGAHRAQMKSFREQEKLLRQAFRQELMKPQLDMDKINALHTRIKALESQTADERLNSFLAVRKILTHQQFVEFTSLMHKHRRENGEGAHEDRD